MFGLHLFFGVAAVAALFIAPTVADGAPQYRIVPLEPLPAGESFAYGLNDRGQVVGDSRKDRTGHIGQSRPVVWNFDGVPHELWSDQGIGGSLADINNAGEMVGRYGSGSGIPLPSPGVPLGRAFYWSEATGRIDMGFQSGGLSMAVAINDNGQVVGTSEVFDVVMIDGVPTLDNLRIHPFIWDAESGIRDLGTLGGNAAFATDINAHGQVVGYSENVDGRTRAFIWDEAAGMRELPNLSGGPARAATINDVGQIIGGEVGIGGLLWDLRDGCVMSVPGGNDINNVGQAVGGAYLWDPAHGLQMLAALIPADSDWQINNSFAINEMGQIVGSGSFNGESRGFLMTPIPEPSAMVHCSLCLLTFGFSTALCGHRQRSPQFGVD